ncbi:MAG TPA: hypothetical protein VFA23_12595 [Dongiaceae bacterium]|nr:hypothetical protein [Dongiaceae bacterium]
MPGFYQLLLSIVGHGPASRDRTVTHAESRTADAAKPKRRGRKSQAPPLFRGDNRLRRDIGLPPLDDRGLPL